MMVPHWVRGEETAALIQFPGQAENTTQKIVLYPLGASIATRPDRIEAELIAVRNFDELKLLPRDKVTGKILLFNYPFDKQTAAEGRSRRIRISEHRPTFAALDRGGTHAVASL